MRVCVYVCILRAGMLVILFDVGETKKKKIQVQACAKIDLFRICADRNEEFVQMYIHLHLWSLLFSLSPSQRPCVASILLTLSSPPLLNQTSRQYPHLHIFNLQQKFINRYDLKSPVQIYVDVD